jgi:hypothetical protein
MDAGVEGSKPTSLMSSPGPGRESKRRLSQGIRASVIALEKSSLEIHEDHITRSIGGRLSGSIRTLRLDDVLADELAKIVDTEEAHLLKKGIPAPSPKITVWIFPALTCASGECSCKQL